MTVQDNKLEALLSQRFYDGVRRLGGICEKLAPTRWGVPDRLVLLPGGRLYLVELKTVSGAVRPAQKVWHQRALALGVEVVVLHGHTQIDQWLLRKAATLEAEQATS